MEKTQCLQHIYMKSSDIFFGWSRQSVGQSKRKFIERIKNHLGYIDQNTKSIGKHFNTPGHSKSDMRCHVIKKVMPNSPHHLLEHEDHWIKTLVTKKPNGLNKK